MRDLMLITPSEENTDWNLDIDIIDGYPEFLPLDRNTQDQRAAVAAYMTRGTIPGMPDEGIDWSGLYDPNNETLITIDNEIKQNIRDKAAVENVVANMYLPVYDVTEDGIGLTIYQG